MDETKGSIDGKRNRRLQMLFKKKKKKLEEQQEVEAKEKKLEEKKNGETVINNNSSNDKNEPVRVTVKVKPKFGIDEKNNELEKDKNKLKQVPNEEKTEKGAFINDNLSSKKDEPSEVYVRSKPKFGINKNRSELEKNNNKYLNQTGNEKITVNKELEEKNKPLKYDENKKNENSKTEEIYAKPKRKFGIEDKNVELKQISQKDLLELAIVNEFEVILKNHKYDLNKLIIEYNILREKVDKSLEVDELEKYSLEIEELVRKLEIIKKEMELLTSSSTFNDIYKLHDSYLENMIDEYKNSVLYNKELFSMVDNLENDKLHVSLIDKIIEFEQEKEKLTKHLNDKKEKYEVRDEEFDNWKKKYLKDDDINRILDDIAAQADEKLSEIENLVNKSVDVREVVEHRMMGTLEIFARTLILMAMVKSNPLMQANLAMAGGARVTFNAIRHMINPDLGTRTRIVTDITDYKDMIADANYDVEKVKDVINDCIDDVSNMKEFFEDHFKEYKHDFPEYKELFDKLEIIEKEMIERKQNMARISRELQYQYDKNNAKVKVYENMSTRQN